MVNYQNILCTYRLLCHLCRLHGLNKELSSSCVYILFHPEQKSFGLVFDTFRMASISFDDFKSHKDRIDTVTGTHGKSYICMVTLNLYFLWLNQKEPN